jgi:long-chain acyl-CoA synthetase
VRQELIAFCREQMAAYKYPCQVEFLDELPKKVPASCGAALRGRD